MQTMTIANCTMHTHTPAIYYFPPIMSPYSGLLNNLSLNIFNWIFFPPQYDKKFSPQQKGKCLCHWTLAINGLMRMQSEDTFTNLHWVKAF